MRLKKFFIKIFQYLSLPFVWIWKGIKYLWIGIKIVGKNFYELLKLVWKYKNRILSLLLIIILFILPLIVIKHLFVINYLKENDWGNVVGGCLGYYGTVILGIVAITQTQSSLKQNANTFIADKYSCIKILRNSSFEVIKNTKILYDNIHTFPTNQYFVKMINDFSYNGKDKLLKLQLFYKGINYPINKIQLKQLSINYQSEFFIDSTIKTDLCENPQKDCGQLEIVFVLNKSELTEMENLLNNGTLIFVFNFEIISSFNVIMNEQIEVNMSSPEIKTKAHFNERTQYWTVETASYKYYKGDKLWKKKK